MGCVSCSGELRREPQAGRLVRAADSIVLQSKGGLELGTISYLVRGADGSLFVSDVRNGRAFRFTSHGVLDKMFGGKGNGPGEFQAADAMGLVGKDSLLAVTDGARKYISLLDARRGQFIRGRGVPFYSAGSSWTMIGDTAVFSLPGTSQILARWNWRTDSLMTLGAIPRRLTRSGIIYLLYGHPEVTPIGNEYLASIPTEPDLWQLDSTGTVIGTVQVPSDRRRGTPADLIDQHMKRLAEKKPLQLLGSITMAIHRLSSGEIAVVHYDADVTSSYQKMDISNIRVYITTLSADLTWACVDAALAFETDAIPMPSFRQDTLLLLSRRVNQDSKVTDVIYLFSLPARQCKDLPTGGVTRARNDSRFAR